MLKMCLYAGDIGDNRYERDTISIYRVPEPLVINNTQSISTSIAEWQVSHYRYPNGQKFNAESMLIDMSTRELIIATKSMIPPFSYVFKASLDIQQDTVGYLEDTGLRLNLPDATDATTSADGQVAIIRTYIGAFLWPRKTRNTRRTLIDILREEECLASVGMQKQGESVALNPIGTSYFTHSEFVNQTIWQYDILN